MKDLASVRVSEIMTSPVVTVPASTSLRDAAKLIEEKRISCAVVEENGVPVGMLTERDLVQCLSRGAGPGEALGARIGRPLVSVEADALVEAALSMMEERSIRHLPAVRDGKVVGLITQTNIMRFSEEMLKGYSQALEEQVRRQTVELHKAGEFKDYILGMAAHDLRNPLSVIIYWCDLLESLEPGETIEGLDARQGLRVIGGQAASMNRLISDILDISRIHRGKLSLNIVPDHIERVLASRIDVHVLLAQKKGIRVSRKVAAGLPEVPMDRERIGAVIDNLLSNAVKYSRKGDSIEVSVSGAPDGGVLVEVADTGQGIEADEMSKLFTEFAKLSGKPTGNETSTGLGLAIVKKVVEQHNGTVFARSLRGKGSTFGFTLPAVSAAQEPAQQSAAA